MNGKYKYDMHINLETTTELKEKKAKNYRRKNKIQLNEDHIEKYEILE